MHPQQQIQEYESYLPPLTKRPDFEEFWAGTLAKARVVELNPARTPVQSALGGAKVFAIRYNGFDETRINGWLLLPQGAGVAAPVPCLVHYHGFAGNRGNPWDFAHWLLQGVAVLTVDCREQCGDTGNAAAYSGGMATNVACKGILDKNEYYYRAVYMDCVKAVDFALQCPEVDPTCVAVEGTSQGGALGMAVAALHHGVALCMVDVPSNCNLEARVEGAHGAFKSVFDYLKVWPHRLEKAYETLSYFDNMNLAERITCPVLASVALRDEVCPAKCYYAAYNRITAEKQIENYPFNGHEGGGSLHTGKKLAFLQKHFG